MLKRCLSNSETFPQLWNLKYPFYVPKPSHKHSVVRSHRSGKASGRRSWSSLWRHQRRSILIIFYTDDIKREIHAYTSRLLANKNQRAWDKYVYIFICSMYWSDGKPVSRGKCQPTSRENVASILHRPLDLDTFNCWQCSGWLWVVVGVGM